MPPVRSKRSLPGSCGYEEGLEIYVGTSFKYVTSPAGAGSEGSSGLSDTQCSPIVGPDCARVSLDESILGSCVVLSA